MAGLANAHGYFETPKARQPGPAFQKACGMQAYYAMSGDINGNIQGLANTVANQPDYNPEKCHLWQCKGMKYADNKENVQRYQPGQTVPMKFHIQAPHDGYANISIISTKEDKIIYPNLKKWSQYALTSTPMKDSWQSFSVKMPTTLGSQCSKPGACAIQIKRDVEGLEMEERAHP
ncbi:hypothetical protein LTR37_013588 [Vermiconidia calcicola]|uniref:Uncharacterized protein n=1 Tax=Vermiconidia calcicola TaxID=1690605 RepID=A0ACC3MXN5_9PEZI|nr:hypothetical protein LTR37_013588 [Vermiconidia calcicola]